MKKSFKKIISAAIAFAIALSLITCSFAAYKGDLNADGEVNATDALVVLKYSVKLIDEIDIKIADMNNDGVANTTDALAILRVAVELDEKVELPEENPGEEPGEPPVLSYYDAIIALKEDYPEGTPWTNDNYYEWNGGIYSGGYGCAGFAFMLSDAAFGDAPATKLTGIKIDDVRVGDILRLNDDTHSVIVLEVYEDYVVIAEGNYNNSVHWGRTLTASEVASATYLMTRYDTLPDTEDPTPPDTDKPTTPPSTAEELVEIYNNAVNKVVSEKAGYKKQRTVTVTHLDAGSYTSAAGDIVKEFLGEGTSNFKNNKGASKYLSTSTLTADDVTNATYQETDSTYTITLELKNGGSSYTSKKTEDNSPIAKTGLLSGKQLNTEYDYLNSESINAGVKSKGAKANAIKAETTNAKITVAVEKETGNMISYEASFDWKVDIDTIKVMFITVPKATGNAQTEVKLSDFVW